jgi:transcriptional regulator with XRE-family HTH domain
VRIAEKVRFVRGGMSQRSFAKALGTSQAVISFVERGGEPSKRLAKKLSAFTGLPLSAFLLQEGEEKPGSPREEG